MKKQNTRNYFSSRWILPSSVAVACVGHVKHGPSINQVAGVSSAMPPERSLIDSSSRPGKIHWEILTYITHAYTGLRRIASTRADFSFLQTRYQLPPN
jgi:hypothetical protein